MAKRPVNVPYDGEQNQQNDRPANTNPIRIRKGHRFHILNMFTVDGVDHGLVWDGVDPHPAVVKMALFDVEDHPVNELDREAEIFTDDGNPNAS